VTEKPRQFDFRCSLTKGRTCVSLAVECKNLSTSAPLVISCVKRRANEAFHDVVESRNATYFKDLPASATRRATGVHAFYPPEGFVGKGAVRLKTTDKGQLARTSDSDIYDKWAQALSSGVDLANSACHLPPQFTMHNFYTAILPLVVVPDDSLWTSITANPKPRDDGAIPRMRMFCEGGCLMIGAIAFRTRRKGWLPKPAAYGR